MDNKATIQNISIKNITFHRAQNHGSVLQTYALCRFVNEVCKEMGLECNYRIIDLFTESQKNLYSIFRPLSNVKNILKDLLALRYIHKLKSRKRRFMQFIKRHIPLTIRYDSTDELKKHPPVADIFLSGSDQIWNVRTTDFSTAYYLDFVSNDCKKISFATSFGPLKIDWERYGVDIYQDLLKSYDMISVREEESAYNVEFLTGQRPEVIADPAFLLDKSDWMQIENQEIREESPYILLYALEPSKAQLQAVRLISNKLNLRVMVLRYNNKNDWFNAFGKRYDAGPSEFLSYLSKASLVLTSSFHGTAFSIIYQKPFYVLDGEKDARISSILVNTGLSSRSIDTCNETGLDIEEINLSKPDFHNAEVFMIQNREKAKQFIKNAIKL